MSQWDEVHSICEACSAIVELNQASEPYLTCENYCEDQGLICSSTTAVLSHLTCATSVDITFPCDTDLTDSVSWTQCTCKVSSN